MKKKTKAQRSRQPTGNQPITAIQLIRAYRPALLVYATIRELAKGGRRYSCTRRTIASQARMDRPSNSGDAIAVLRAAQKRKGQELSFANACQMLRKGAQRRNTGLNVSSTVITSPKCPAPSQAALERAEAEVTHAHQTLLNTPDFQALLWTQRAIDKDTAGRFRVGYTRDNNGRAWRVSPLDRYDNRCVIVSGSLIRDSAGSEEDRWESTDNRRAPTFDQKVSFRQCGFRPKNNQDSEGRPTVRSDRLLSIPLNTASSRRIVITDYQIPSYRFGFPACGGVFPACGGSRPHFHPSKTAFNTLSTAR